MSIKKLLDKCGYDEDAMSILLDKISEVADDIATQLIGTPVIGETSMTISQAITIINQFAPVVNSILDYLFEKISKKRDKEDKYFQNIIKSKSSKTTILILLKRIDYTYTTKYYSTFRRTGWFATNIAYPY